MPRTIAEWKYIYRSEGGPVFDGSTTIEEAVRRKILPGLETFPCPYTGSSGIIRIVFPEFTCLCPKTGYPDFAAIRLHYLPDKVCLELKSWKLYLNAFRNVGTFHEAVTAHMFTTVIDLLKPRWALVVGDFFPRGNVDTTVVFETETPRPRAADILLTPSEPLCRGFARE